MNEFVFLFFVLNILLFKDTERTYNILCFSFSPQCSACDATEAFHAAHQSMEILHMKEQYVVGIYVGVSLMNIYEAS